MGKFKGRMKNKTSTGFPPTKLPKAFFDSQKNREDAFSSEENSGKDAKKQPQQKRKRATSAVHPMLKKCLIIKIKIKDTLSFYRSAFR